MNPRTKTLLTIQTLCIITVLALLLNKDLLYILKPYTNLFGNGISNFKTYLPFIYAFLLSFAWYRPSHKPVSKKPLVLALIALLLGVAQFTYITTQSGLDHRVAYYYEDTEYSSNRLIHIHNSKTVLNPAPDLTPQTITNRFDHGLPYHSWIPKALIIPLTGTLLAYLYTVWKNAKRIENPVQATLYGIATYLLTKNIIDGGLFNTETFIGLPLLYIALAGQTNIKAVATVTVGGALAGYGIQHLLYRPIDSFLLALCRPSFIVATCHAIKKQYKRATTLLLLVTILLFHTLAPLTAYEHHRYNQNLPPDTTVSYTTYAPQNIPPNATTYNVGRATVITHKTQNATTVKDILDQTKGFTRIRTVKTTPCNHTTTYAIRLDTKHWTPQSQYHATAKTELVREGRTAVVSIPNCVPSRDLHIANILQASGTPSGAWTPIEKSKKPLTNNVLPKILD